MEDIPIFSGEKTELDSWLTFGQFLSMIENIAWRSHLTEVEIKEFCLLKLSDNALELFQNNLTKSWNELKNLMFEKFPVQLTISEKVEVRKRLQQLDSESIDEFYERCIQAQYLVSDDIKDVGFEREVLLHFLIGLSPLIRDLVLSTKCSSSNDYVNEAKKYVKIVKKEPLEENIKIEVDPYYEDSDIKSSLNDFEEHLTDLHENELTNLEKSSSNRQCDECGDTFSSYFRLKMHCQSFHKKCAKCDKTFVNKDKHYQIFHSKVKCKYCEFVCKDSKQLRAHMKENHLDKKKDVIRCRVCSEVLKSRQIRSDHEDKLHGHLKQTCEICNEVCLTINFLCSHIASKHCTLTPDQKFICLYCNIVKKSSARLLGYHISNKHFNQPRFSCNLCDKGFDEKNCLVSHMKYNHTTEKLFQCDKCAKNFKTVGLLNSHVKNMHEESKNLECKECGKLFKNKMYLRNHHRNSHVTKTRIVCDDCGKSFAQKQSFLDHSLTHLTEEDRQQKELLCPFPGCDYTNLKKPNLDKHIKRVHEKQRNFQCSLCPKSFFNKTHFDEHTNGVHLNLKPFQCDNCEFATAYRTTLNEHKKVAHGNQRYDCPYCNHSARYKGNLDKHINNVHKNLQSILMDKVL